jgi:hypothetical protein
MAETSRSALLRELGAEVQAARQAADLGLRELARRAALSTHSRLSELEAGKRLLPAGELNGIFDVLDLSLADRERLLGLARAAEGPGQLNVGAPGVSATLMQLIDHERAATRIIDASPLLVPGLLQTSDYARSIMGDEPDTELLVTLRSGRRDILVRRRDPVELIALIDSEALIRPVASPQVMLDQWRHILQLAELPNVAVHVVSSTVCGYHPMLAGPFELIEFATASAIVLLDHHRSSAFLWDSDAVRPFVEAAEKIQMVAMTPDESIGVIAKIVHGTETT